MPYETIGGSILDGQLLAELREAICDRYDQHSFDMFLADHDHAQDFPSDWNLQKRAQDCIALARREGWLIALCRDLVADRKANALIKDAAMDVASKLVPVLPVVLSSVEHDAAWKKGLFAPGGFFDALVPAPQPVDTLDLLKQSRGNVASVWKEIEGARLFVAIVSRHFIGFAPAAAEFERALAQLARDLNGRPPARRVLAVTRDEEARIWVAQAIARLEAQSPGLGQWVLSEDVSGAGAIDPDGRLLGLARELRCAFDDMDHHEAPPAAPAPQPPVRPKTVVILGEPKLPVDLADGGPGSEAAIAREELAADLARRAVPHERWADGWRKQTKPLSVLAARPIFVRTVTEDAAAAASRLASELNVVFGFQFDEEGESVRPLMQCPRLLWIPGGREALADAGPNASSSTAGPLDLGRWLADLIGVQTFGGNAIARYEDPAAQGDYETPERRTIVEGCLLTALAGAAPPLAPDAVRFGGGHLPEVIEAVGQDALTVIAVHDLPTRPGSKESTIERFRQIDQCITHTLAAKGRERAPLIKVAVLLRNADLFPAAVAFNSSHGLPDWRLLRIPRTTTGGALAPDPVTVDNLRMDVANLAGQRAEALL